MKSFKTFISEAIIDVPRTTFAKDIFTRPERPSPKLRANVKAFIMEGLTAFKNIAPIIDFQLIGSILTHRYRDDADLDINVWFDLSVIPTKKQVRKLA